MAGSIIISHDQSWPVSSSVLDAVAELTQMAWPISEASSRDEVFSEVEVFKLIDLSSMSAATFQLFTRTTIAAFSHLREFGPPVGWSPRAFTFLQTPWEYLIQLLKSDVRWEGEKV